jgi:hypothetical protein
VSRNLRRIDTEQRQKADQVRRTLAQKVEHITSQKNLTSQGRASRLAAAVISAQSKMARLRADEAEQVSGRRDELQRQLFGHTRPDDSRIISIRDAADRAARVKNADQMARLMNGAERHGDTVLLRAAAVECYSRRNGAEPVWQHLVNQWAAEQPGGADAVTELETITGETDDPEHRLSREGAFRVPLPDDLHGKTGSQIQALAGQADDDSGVIPPSHTELASKHLASIWHPEVDVQ